MSAYREMDDYLARTDREHGDLYAGLDGDCPRCRYCDWPLDEDTPVICDGCLRAKEEQMGIDALIDERRDRHGERA